VATQTIYLLNTAATAPNWFGRVQDNGSAPAGALSAFGWTVAKIALTTPYWRGRIGATARSTAAQAASYIDAATGPVQGTGSAATTAGDSFRSDNPLSGTFAAGNWNFTFGMRTGAASNAGRIRCNMWASVNADGTGARELNAATLVGTIVTMNSITATFNSTITWAAPQIVLNNEYLFLQVEWQVTTVGTSNSCTAQFYQCSFVTTNYVYAIPAVDDVTPPFEYTAPDLGQEHVFAGGVAIAGSPVLEAPTLAVAAPLDNIPAATSLAVNSPDAGAATLTQNHVLAASALTVQPPTLDAAAVGLPAIPLIANSLAATAPSLGTPAMLPIILISASNLATAPPPAVTATFGQEHALTTGAFVPTSPPALTAATLTQRQAFIATALVVPIPTIGSGTFAQTSVLMAISATAGTPAFEAGLLGQAGVMTPIPVAAGVPFFGTATFGQKHLIAAINATINPPAFSIVSLAQQHLIAAPIVAVNPPVLATVTLAQTHALTAAFTVSPPVLGAAVMSQAGVMAAVPLAVGAPVLGTPAFTQRHLLVAAGVSAGPPAVAVLALALRVDLTAGALATDAPIIEQRGIGQHHVLLSSPVISGQPVVPTAFLGQAGIMAAVPLWIPAPTLPVLALRQRHGFTGNGVAISAPVLAAAEYQGRIQLPAPWAVYAGHFQPLPAILGQTHQLTALTASAGAPRPLPATLVERETFPAASLVVSAPVLGTPTMAPIAHCVAVGLAPHPQLGVAQLNQEHKVQIAALSVANPYFGRPNLDEWEFFPAPLGVTVEAPTIDTPMFVLLRRNINAVTITSRRPTTSITTGPVNEPEWVPVVGGRRSSAVTGQRNAAPMISGRMTN
jgi:hypothetical protein